MSAAFSDLPESAAQAYHFYNGSRDPAHGQDRLFWLQFQDPTRNVVLGEKLKQLGELHKLARLAMEDIFMAMWPEEEIPGTFFDLGRCLWEARARIGIWKSSAAREGARQAWGMLQMHFPDLDIQPIAEVGPAGPNGEEMKPDSNFARVMEFARMSELTVAWIK